MVCVLQFTGKQVFCVLCCTCLKPLGYNLVKGKNFWIVRIKNIFNTEIQTRIKWCLISAQRLFILKYHKKQTNKKKCVPGLGITKETKQGVLWWKHNYCLDYNEAIKKHWKDILFRTELPPGILTEVIFCSHPFGDCVEESLMLSLLVFQKSCVYYLFS